MSVYAIAGSHLRFQLGQADGHVPVTAFVLYFHNIGSHREKQINDAG